MRRHLPIHWILLALTVSVTATACGGEDTPTADTGIEVIASTTILGDIASNVVGDAGTVTTLIPVGASPHDYQTSAQQAAAIQQADLVIVNGLGLEEGLSDILDSARADGANIVEVAPLVDPLPFDAAGDDDHHTGGETTDEAHGSDDPHFWLDPVRDAAAARVIASELTAVAPEVDWSANAETYADALMATNDQIIDILSSVAPENRKLVTNHQSFGYFAQRYDFAVIGIVIPGGSTLAEPSSAELSALVAAVKDTGVTAIFGETTESVALADALASEIGADVTVVKLYTGSLGQPGSGAETLIGLLRTNAELIANALS